MSESILIIGGGGREHALGWKLAWWSGVERLSFVPGNAGTEELGDSWRIPLHDLEGLARQAKNEGVDFVIIGPDEPLADGAADIFLKNDILTLGPTKAAARLESSKSHAAWFMDKNGIPQAETYYETHQISHAAAYAGAGKRNATDYVIKADWLMRGKGVCLPETEKEAIDFILGLVYEKSYANSNKGVLFQERLEGEELSVFVLTDGKKGIILPYCRDYKRLLDGNRGPNTGGMGAYGPVPTISKDLEITIKKKIIEPTLAGMAELGTLYQGVLYIGLMLTKEGPKVLEYNARFGDPECQALMLLMDENIFPLLYQAAAGKLKQDRVKTLSGYALTVALSAPNYGYGEPEVGAKVHGLDSRLPLGVHVFHGGTRREGSHILSSGGRVLHVATHAETLDLARERIYESMGKHALYFEGMHYRQDIGQVIS